MALLCFLLDLRNIPPPLLRRLKQCLLHLANLYAATTSPTHPASAPALPDRLALVYVHHAASSGSSSSSSSSSPELKIGYRPGEKFSLRDFHQAVNNVPLDGFLPEQGGQSLRAGDVSLENLFSNRAIYSWATDDISKKVVAICMSVQNIEALRRSLMDAAEQCVAVDFVILETEAPFVYDGVSDNVSCLENRICDLENCVVRRYSPDPQVLHGLVKRWLEELKDDKEETLQAVLMFREPIVNSVKQIYCNLYASTNQIIDTFPYCQICKCHGHPIDLATNKAKWLCPVTSRQLAASDVTDTAVRIGEQTILFLSTSEGGSNLQRASTSISLNVIERTELASINEGVIMGTPYIVIPSSNDVEIALTDEGSDQNTQIFYGLCRTLFELDQGLICSSSCNTQIMKNGTLQCFYLLQPSERGAMLLRRLAGSEEILPLPCVSGDCNSTVIDEIKSSIGTSLSKIVLKDYNPLQHERGFHSKLISLVKDSLQFGAIDPAYAVSDSCHVDSFSEPPVSACGGPEENKFLIDAAEMAGGLNDHIHSFSEPQGSFRIPNENKVGQSKNGKVSPSISEEWEKLIIIDDLTDDFATPAAPRPAAVKPQRTRPPSPVKQLDEKTSRILERLEAPKAKKPRANTGKASTSTVPASSRVASVQTKKPLLPSQPCTSPPLKPTFNRSRRKLPT